METLDSPGMPPDTPTDADDGLYPCKGCGEILEEGKAFELAGNRWHIDCFRCNTCGTLLDSDANLLLLGDGSLICNNCTYSCSACGNKIEDLAILTGQEAFCAQCFKCRNCKKKIENLRYARTSQGIFCMQCHESLMARRRKKTRATGRTTSTNSNGSNPTIMDKSLPALPPGAVPSGALSGDIDSPASLTSETPTERSPAMRQPVNMKGIERDRHASPLSYDRFDEFRDNLGIPRDDLGTRRISDQSSRSNGSRGDDDNHIPITLDTMPRPPAPLRSRSSENRVPRQPTQPGVDERSHDFGDLVAGSAPRSGSMDRSQTSPHIMQQAMGRQSSNDRITGLRRRDGSIKTTSPTSTYTSPTFDRKPTSPTSPTISEEQFRLAEAPKARRRSSGSKRGSKTSNGAATSPNMALAGQTEGSQVLPQETQVDTAPMATLPTRKISTRQKSPLSNSASASSQDPAKPDRPQRTDSVNKTQTTIPPHQAIPRKQVPRSDAPATTTAAQPSIPERQHSDPALHEPQTAPPAVAGRSMTVPIDDDTFTPPPRSSSRPTPAAGLSSAAMNSQSTSKNDFTSPREAPQPPPTKHKPNESLSSIQSEHFTTRDGAPLAPTNTETGDEDQFGRMGSDESIDQGMFRKVSKVMRHGRSHSDKAGNGSPRFAKSSRNGSIDISSPMIGSNEANDDATSLRNKLRFSQQRILELESEKNTLQDQVNGVENIRQVNTELREKRSTMTFLDTQREMIMRELETMTDQLAKAKESKGPINVDNIKNDALRDFAHQLQRLRESLTGQIEGLMEQKNKLTDEITNLIQMKDKGFQEYESVHAKNQQLREHNAQLVASIQDIYRHQKQPPNAMGTNALGISTGTTTGIHNGSLQQERKGSLGPSIGDENSLDFKSALSLDRSTNASTMSAVSGDTEVAGEPARFIEGPRVVDMRKGGQAKKFSWKKGSESMAKNVKKGFKGAFASSQGPSQSSLREESFSESVPYGQLQAGDAPVIGDRPVGQRNGIESQRQGSGQGWGFLSAQKGGTGTSRSVSQSALSSGAPPDTLFGSDLTARCEYEGRVIPALISRCIDEVDQRGLDVEGIYRKSGSYSQVKSVQSGFEKDAKFDISDEDLDIHAVTSALKQYLRKLPLPLITYDAYDEMVGAATAAMNGGSDAALVEGCSRAVGILPEHHRNTLEILVGHLVRVNGRERENKMNATNIAVVFAPTIMRPQSVDREMADMEAQRRAVQCLLGNYKTVFGA